MKTLPLFFRLILAFLSASILLSNAQIRSAAAGFAATLSAVNVSNAEPIPGTYVISGYLTDDGANSIASVHVYGINAGNPTVSALTQPDGSYSLVVSNGGWNISVDCADLNALGYSCAQDLFVNVSGEDVSDVDFAVSISPLQITTLFLPNATQNQFYRSTLAASGGQPPYRWALSLGSASLPSNLTLGTSNGVLSGTVTSPGMTYFIVQVSDAVERTASQVLAITVDPSINPGLVLTAPTRLANGRFQFTLDTTLGVNYTIEYSIALKVWIPILGLIGPGGPLTIVDPGASSDKQRFYRVEIGP